MIGAAQFVLSLVCALAAHPTSSSSSRIVVDHAHVALELRCQQSSLFEALPLDRNGDGALDANELENGHAELERYVLDGYRLTTGCSGAPSTGRRLGGRLLSIAPAAADGPRVEPLFDLELAFDAPAPLEDLGLEFELFRESDPWHRDHAEIVWNGAAAEAQVLWIEDPTWTFTPHEQAARSVVAQYIGVGIQHILSGYDHIAFLVALIVAARRFRSLLGIVTAFTLAHSLTLALAALSFVRLPAQLVETSIALSIAYVGVRNLVDRSARRLWPEAFGFGLVHGLGFAGSLAELLATEPHKLGALFGFNVGVEIGQLAIVIGVSVLIRSLTLRWSTKRDTTQVTLAPRWIRLSASAVVGALGVYWFCVRAWP